MSSIKDVARLAGVSTTTVSRVLTQPQAVRPLLRAQVQAVIDQLGYRPNLAARRLRQRRASLVGLVISDIRNPFFTDIGRAVEDVAYQNDLRLIVCNTDEDPKKERAYLDLMKDEQASGVIFSATDEGLARIIQPQGFPVVMIDRIADRMDNMDSVQIDNEYAAIELTQHLLGNGYQQIVMLSGASSSTGRARQKGYERAMRAAGLSPQVLAEPPRQAEGERATRALLESHRPEALLASNGLLLLGAAQAIHAAGLRMPEDIALAGFDNNDWTSLTQPGITVFAQPTYEIGRTAAELLLQRMSDPKRSARKMVLHGEMLVRGSSARRCP